MALATTIDFLLADHGNILVLTPLSEDAKAWANAHLPRDAQRWGRGVAIEARYWPPIERGIENDGLTVRS